MLDGQDHLAYSNTNWPKCQKCGREMNLAGQSVDHYAFKCMACGCVRAWSTPSNATRARAQTTIERRSRREQEVKALTSKPLFFDLASTRSSK